MTYEITKEGTSLTICLFGHLDLNGSPIVEEALEPELDYVNDLTVDLCGVDYVSSMGLRLLLALHKRMSKQGTMVVTNVCEQVMELFDETGFSNILTLE